MRKSWFLRSLVLFGLSAAAILGAQTVRNALPGTINYVEGQVSINGRLLREKLKANTRATANQTICIAGAACGPAILPTRTESRRKTSMWATDRIAAQAGI